MHARVLLMLVLATALHTGATGSAAEASAAWLSGGGTLDGSAAQAEWLLVEDHVASYLIETADGRIATCQRGNGTLQTRAGELARGTCGGSVHAERTNETLLWFETTTGGRIAGTFTNEHAETLLPVAESTPGIWPGVALIAAATLGLTLSAALAVLWHRERGLTLHLARRLAAVRGNGAKKGKSGDEKDHVARILVRSRN